MIDELRPAIYTKGSAVAGLTGGFWYVEAAQEKKSSYAVFSFVTATNTRDTATLFEKIFLQINIYDFNPATLETLSKNMIDEFDDSEADFSLANYYFNRIERTFVRGPVKLGDIYQVTIQYEIDLTKK